MSDVQIPSKAISDGADIEGPTRALLEGLRLLGSDEEANRAKGAGAVLKGPPQSIALIEAGATAAAKWWAAGLGATVVATWAAVAGWWGDQSDNVKVVVLGGASLVTAALIISIGYLIASDVRGRAAAAVATINARSAVARTMIETSADAFEPASSDVEAQLVPLPAKVAVKKTAEPAGDEDDWCAIAMLREGDGTIKYVVVKDSRQTIVGADGLSFG